MDHLLTDIAAVEGYDSTLKTVESELTSWAISYEAVRAASQAWVREIWQSPQKGKRSVQDRMLPAARKTPITSGGQS